MSFLEGFLVVRNLLLVEVTVRLNSRYKSGDD